VILDDGDRVALIGLHKLMQLENGGFVVELHHIIADERERRADLSNVIPLPRERRSPTTAISSVREGAAAGVIAFARTVRQSAGKR
jgi:hypothetical protein